MVEEKRRAVRRNIPGISITISDGTRIFSDCDVTDVSTGGLLVKGIPSKYVSAIKESDVRMMTAIVNFKHKTVKVKISPRWTKDDNSIYAQVGFEVVGEIQNWFEFIRTNTKLVQKRHEDVWGISGHKYVNN